MDFLRPDELSSTESDVKSLPYWIYYKLTLVCSCNYNSKCLQKFWIIFVNIWNEWNDSYWIWLPKELLGRIQSLEEFDDIFWVYCLVYIKTFIRTKIQYKTKLGQYIYFLKERIILSSVAIILKFIIFYCLHPISSTNESALQKHT